MKPVDLIVGRCVEGGELLGCCWRLAGADPRFEIQLLEFEPAPGADSGEQPTNLRRRGYNHLAFRVDDIDAVAAQLEANGVRMLSEQMNYISRKLRFIEGPECITIELVQWVEPSGPA